MNIERLNRVIEAIKAEPKHFEMQSWATGENLTSDGLLKLDDKYHPACGTAACIGGWIESMANKEILLGTFKRSNDGRSLTRDWLEIDIDDEKNGEELSKLFHMDHWYSMSRFDRLPDDLRAKAGVRAVEIFRDTGESDWAQALSYAGIDEDDVRN